MKGPAVSVPWIQTVVPSGKKQREELAELAKRFGVPECLLSDRGTNLLSNLMTELCRMLGITKPNTTAYHLQRDGSVERFNHTLKTMLRKHAAKFGCQWNRFLPGILWAYRNTPHTSMERNTPFCCSKLTAGRQMRLHFSLPLNLVTLTSVTMNMNSLYHSLRHGNLSVTASTSLRVVTRSHMTAKHDHRSYALETGYWCTSHRRSLGAGGSCLAPGMGHTGW